MASSNSLSPSGAPTSTSPLKRKRSKESMSTTSVSLTAPEPAAMSPKLSPIILPDIHRNPDEPYVEPASPAPTEIVEELVELTNQDHVIAAKEAGVKVRDFAYQPPRKGHCDIRAPEHWARPLDRLVIYDHYIRLNPSSERFSNGTPGKLLWGLLSTGLVSQQEAKANWRPEVEWKAYKAYVNRPLGPYPVCVPKAFKQPTAAYRQRLLLDAFNLEFVPGDLRPQTEIFTPPDVPGMDDGPEHLPEPDRPLRRLARPRPSNVSRRTLPSHPATPVPSTSSSATPGHNATVDAVHVDKRRRTSGPPAVPSVGASDTPPATPPADSSRLSRSASYSPTAGSSRSGTPPADEVPRPSLGRGLARTRTLSRIPVQ